MNLTVIGFALWLVVVGAVAVIWFRGRRPGPGNPNPPQQPQNPSETEEGEPR